MTSRTLVIGCDGLDAINAVKVAQQYRDRDLAEQKPGFHNGVIYLSSMRDMPTFYVWHSAHGQVIVRKETDI